MMLQFSTYSVISPEGCASILWKSAAKAPEAAEALGLTAHRLKALGLIDKIINEPLGGAHRDPKGMAALLDAGAVKSLADYFSHQPATRGATGDATLTARGQEIFERGVPDKGVPACASCHGAEAQGAGTFPRLAGQHKEYLLRQIEVFKNGTRGNA
ncbi:c-type cytochrome, partial [Serratia marcescens]|uniref:c-type cytochrome n=1 Tax=Serratia marcescens TaxID=615 RepID=UPI000B216F2F